MIPGKFNGRLLPSLGAPDTPPAAIDPVLLAFDDGQHITMADAVNHTVAFGTTGSGKTSCVIIPMIKPLLEKGLSGLILDIIPFLNQTWHHFFIWPCNEGLTIGLSLVLV